MSTRRFYKITFLFGITYLCIAVLNLVKQKIIAHYTGTAGMGIMGLLNSYSSLLYTFGSLSIYAGVTKYISEYKSKQDSDSLQSLWSTIYTLLLLFSIGITLLFCAFAKYFSGYFLGEGTLIQFFIIVTLSLPFYVISNLYIAGYKGLQSFRVLAVLQMVSAFLTLLVTFYMVRNYQVQGMVYSLAISMVLQLLVCFLTLFSQQSIPFRKLTWILDIKVIKNLLGFTVTTLVPGLLFFGIQFLVRIQIVKSLGLDKNGLIQAAIYFSLYFQIVQDALTTYLLPRLSELKDNQAVNHEINTALRLSGLMTLPVVAALVLLIRPVISILLTRDFQIIETFAIFIFLGDFVRLLYWTGGTYFLAHGKLKTSFWISILYSLAYGGLILFFIQRWDMWGYGVGYLLANMVVLIATGFYLFRLIRFKILLDNLILILSGVALVIVCFLLDKSNPGYLVLCSILILVWCILSIRKQEWDFIKNKWQSLNIGN